VCLLVENLALSSDYNEEIVYCLKVSLHPARHSLISTSDRARPKERSVHWAALLRVRGPCAPDQCSAEASRHLQAQPRSHSGRWSLLLRWGTSGVCSPLRLLHTCRDVAPGLGHHPQAGAVRQHRVGAHGQGCAGPHAPVPRGESGGAVAPPAAVRAVPREQARSPGLRCKGNR